MFLKIIPSGQMYIVVDAFEDLAENIESLDDHVVMSVTNESLYTTIKQALAEAKIVSFSKSKKKGLMGTDLVIEDTDLEGLELARSLAMREAKSLFSARVGVDFMFKVFSFTVANNMLVDSGIVITDENREEKYIEVINEGDEAKIAMLEKYLVARDAISVLYFAYGKLQELLDSIKEAETEEEIDALLDSFKSTFPDLTINEL